MPSTGAALRETPPSQVDVGMFRAPHKTLRVLVSFAPSKLIR